METAQSHGIVARLDTNVISLQLISHEQATEDYQVYQEPNHILALQRIQPLGSCEGRYRDVNLRGDFSHIGRLLVLPADIPLEVRSRCRPEQVMRVVFTSDTLRRFGGDCDVYDRGALSTFLNVRHREMTNLLTLLGDELACPGLASEVLAEGLGIALMVQFARYLSSQARGEVRYLGGLSRRHLNLIADAVEQEDICPTLSELSDLVGLSMRHLTRAFKQSTGVTVHNYVEQARLKKIKILLADTDLLMKDIASRLGFSCASSLSVAFRKLTGETPQEYRKRLRRASTRVAISRQSPLRAPGTLLS